MSTFYAVNIGPVAERRKKLEKALEEAEATSSRPGNMTPAIARKRGDLQAQIQASSELHFFEERGAARTSRT